MKQNSLICGKVLRAAAVASLCLLSVLASATFVAAQDAATGKVTGTIKDQRGANVSGAEISLLHQQRAVVATTTSDGNGNFTLDNVAPGYYEVKVVSAGFTEFHKAVAVTSNATVELAVSL
ncbi:MAG TPA: carboxypeptidase-like regulatory domain-containing protein, partial [Pyrinomonadaceae bacterium]|nr:carboxypeptidase-like regulatory domain-containing protein [Pyrinomonadaceae bacterium]